MDGEEFYIKYRGWLVTHYLSPDDGEGIVCGYHNNSIIVALTKDSSFFGWGCSDSEYEKFNVDRRVVVRNGYWAYSIKHILVLRQPFKFGK